LDIWEALRETWRFKSLLFALSPAHRLMQIFGSIVRPFNQRQCLLLARNGLLGTAAEGPL
jgi:hypothetical protein